MMNVLFSHFDHILTMIEWLPILKWYYISLQLFFKHKIPHCSRKSVKMPLRTNHLCICDWNITRKKFFDKFYVSFCFTHYLKFVILFLFLCVYSLFCGMYIHMFILTDFIYKTNNRLVFLKLSNCEIWRHGISTLVFLKINAIIFSSQIHFQRVL